MVSHWIYDLICERLGIKLYLVKSDDYHEFSACYGTLVRLKLIVCGDRVEVSLVYGCDTGHKLNQYAVFHLFDPDSIDSLVKFCDVDLLSY